MVNISNSHLGPGDPRGAGHCGLPSLLLPDLPCPSPQGTSNGLGSVDDIETGSVRGVRGQVEMGSWGGLSPISPRPLGGQASQAPPLQIRAPEGSLPWGLPEAWKQIVGSGKASPSGRGEHPPSLGGCGLPHSGVALAPRPPRQASCPSWESTSLKAVFPFSSSMASRKGHFKSAPYRSTAYVRGRTCRD